MGFEALFTLGVVALMFAALLFTHHGPDMVLMAGLALLIVFGILEPVQALSGFSNQGMITVGVLYVVAAGISETGAIWLAVHGMLGRPRNQLSAQAKIMGPVAVVSAFLNNTPVVAMMLPAINDWARKYGLPASKLLIPLSYAAILGGMCSLIGTSTNLVVNGLLIDAAGERLGMFEIAKVGVPCAVIGIGFVLLTARWLLPDRSTLVQSPEGDLREYVLEMEVAADSPLIGKTIEQAGLRHLPGLYLMEIAREGQTLPAVDPERHLQGGDHLMFVGVLDSVVDLQRFPGLKPATDQTFKLAGPASARRLVEAVVSNTSPVVGKSIREGRFRNVYNAVVIAVARNGETIRKKIGDIIVRPGDTLLLEALPTFLRHQRNSRDFYLVSQIEGYTPPRHEKAWIALAILALMVSLVTFTPISMLQASLIAAGLMIATRCCTGEIARQSIDFRVLLAIAAAFGIGRGLEVSGAAAAIAHGLLGFAGSRPLVALAMVYVLTVLFTEMITNNAAAVLVFPIARATAEGLQVSFMPFVILIMIGASASFATPIGYQTNLMIYGPGGYRFGDFLRIGIPMALLIGASAVSLCPLFWPL